jgi:hypothetical protein
VRGLSLWQPWASAIAVGAKRIETRSWGTSYRGPVAIHAAKRFRLIDMCYFHASWTWCAALHSLGWEMGKDRPGPEDLPLGAFVAVAELVDVRPTRTFTVEEIETDRRPPGEPRGADWLKWSERQMGDFTLGRYGWVLENVRALPAPILYKGQMGLWTLGDDVTAEIEASLLEPVP